MVKQAVKFGIVGVANTIIDFVLLNFFIAIVGWPILLANTLSFSAAVTNSYFMNKYWTFRNNEPTHIRQFSTFALISTVGLILSNILVHYGTELLGTYDFNLTFAWQYNIAKAVSAAIVLAWNFMASKYLVFYERE
ncbi:hypothetical protein DRH29_01590 [candidate division Kazan bacterium]|uniref:GtrA/DPMS transmembrane domain-containing protein n=1 Tax=candidate division Kazan bacterium TaxID=2202143 RepID=A0A420ZDH0_UNCK3|nr:MAG: hypothetical protein DRH29_01590 [candidate division Kazan bacterium]